MSLPNRFSKTHLTPLLAVMSGCLIALASGCCGIQGGCGIGAYGHGSVVDAGYDAACGPGVHHDCTGLKRLLYPFFHPLGCGSGCGEIYWNEWACDPPDCCDPCDIVGGYVGPQTCHGPPLIASAIHCVGRGVSDLLGAILGGIGCGPCAVLNCGGCGSCGSCDGGPSVMHSDYGGGCADCGSVHPNETIMHEPEVAHPASHRNTFQSVGPVTQQIRSTHGRSPHRRFSRRIR